MDIIISGCEKDTNIYKKFTAYNENINVASITHTNEETIQQFLEKNPDLLLLDTTSDNLNLLYLLSKLSMYDKNIGHRIILITEPSQYSIVDSTQFLSIIQKPITQELILGSIYKSELKKSQKISSQDIKKLFLKLKIDLYSNGIHYLIEAILMAAKNHRLLQNLQEIYARIGLEHNLSYDKVKWSIRSTVDTINKYADAQLLSTVFKYYDEARPLTPKYFIKLALYYFDIDSDE